MDPRSTRDGRLLPLHGIALTSPDDVPRLAGGGYLAVGTTILHGNPRLTPDGATALEWLNARRPVARTRTFFIYDCAEPPSFARLP